MTQFQHDFVFRDGGIADQIQAQIDAARAEGIAEGKKRAALVAWDYAESVTDDDDRIAYHLRLGARGVWLAIDALEGQHD